jgi:hypothetical protein
MKQTIDAQRSPNPPRAPPPKNSPMLRSSSCQPNMSNVLADLKRATSKESSEREKLTHSAPPAVNPLARNDSTLAQPEQPQSRNSPQRIPSATLQSNSNYPSQLLNNEYLKTRYPQDEPITPERTSPVQSEQQSTLITTQKSSESETGPAQGLPSDSNTGAQEKASVSPRTTSMTRRDRRDRVRSRSFAHSKNRSTPQTTPASSSAPPEPTSQPEKPAPKATASPSAPQSSARAAARDRYARHKKMMHQRNNTAS